MPSAIFSVPRDIGDEVEIDRAISEAMRPVLSSFNKPNSFPPGRDAMFKGFMRRSVEGALLTPLPVFYRQYLDELWQLYLTEITANGFLPTVLDIISLAKDADAKDERRGYAWTASFQHDAFLSNSLDVCDLLREALETVDLDIWQRFPAWFGSVQYGQLKPQEIVARRRVLACRWLPIVEYDDPLIYGLLDDDVRELRHVAAMRLGQLGVDRIDDKILDRLRDAAADTHWIWSPRDHYESSRTGDEEACEMLANFGVEFSPQSNR